MFTPLDQSFMRRALELAERGLYTAAPNPRVGAVLVKDGRTIGEGWHQVAGEAHAEVNAVRDAQAKGGADAARGTTAYVTLEPCNHQGRTPPCADFLVQHGIARVVAAMEDPNPKVAGSGFGRLRAAGIDVRVGLLAREARELNIGFVSRMTRGLPWVRLKVAASLDGKTALANGQSQWITGAEARKDGHAWRARSCAILSGIGTVLEDDPQLNVRDVATPRQPLKIIVDSALKIPAHARVLSGGRVLIACGVDDPAARRRLEDAAGASGASLEFVCLPNAGGKVELPDLMRELGARQFNEVHVESGFKLNGSLLRERCVDEVLIYFAASIIGDSGQGMFNLPELTRLEDRQRLKLHQVTQLGDDLRLIARIH
ncbi:MAG: bifunctional diaminohydroxyphosphoribosylaminopyrimidine deaminase/5-amino-6-(5-phosphoribosylamino)uracil reductase RibD [Burkholderiales bacterium]|nr:bifunctional diaminohydroxyphosphoribosylaminopyrimidine deaminase/5-amino-6-(5-phosphoribosylamino)uracil reductase RibD [Burkholderiales bacterium]